jgi:hypothetical protein
MGSLFSSKHSSNNARELHSDDRSKMRYEVLRGGFGDWEDDLDVWRTPRFMLAVFISSTFKDTVEERNILVDEVAPELRTIGQDKGVEVMFVDFRWGIRSHSFLEHGTWQDCREGLDFCKSNSSGLFFLSLQSSRYGFRYHDIHPTNTPSSHLNPKPKPNHDLTTP